VSRNVTTQFDFATARKTLGLSIDQAAAELNVPPHSVAAMETGRIRVPGRIARELTWRVALRQREEILAQSGLPEGETAAALERSAAGTDPEFASSIRPRPRSALHAAGRTLIPIGRHAPDGSYVQAPFGVVFDVVEHGPG